MPPRDLEAELEKIRRRAGNKQCPNCAAEDRVGLRNFVCKFEQIVCSDCKAAHQAFSHRCKGINMSTFTEEEVDRLAATSNAQVAACWLGRLTREEVIRMSPSKSDKPEVWHHWIKRIYINKEFYLPGGGGGGGRPEEAPKKKKASRKSEAPQKAPTPAAPHVEEVPSAKRSNPKRMAHKRGEDAACGRELSGVEKAAEAKRQRQEAAELRKKERASRKQELIH